MCSIIVKIQLRLRNQTNLSFNKVIHIPYKDNLKIY